MHRISILMAVIVTFTTASWTGTYPTRAQNATPISQGGVTFEVVAAGASDAIPLAPATVSLLRFTLAPDAINGTSADDPSLALISEVTGTVTVRLAASVEVSRAGAEGPLGSRETIAAGTDFTLGPGDSLTWPPFVAGEVRNEGTEPATALVVLIAPRQAQPSTASTPTS